MMMTVRNDVALSLLEKKINVVLKPNCYDKQARFLTTRLRGHNALFICQLSELSEAPAPCTELAH